MLMFHRTPFLFLYLLSESLGLTVAWYLTVFVRWKLNPYMAQKVSQSELLFLAPPLSGIILVWVVVGLWLRGRWYNRPGLAPRDAYSLWFLFETVLLAGATWVLVTFFSRELGANLSRSFVLLFVPISFVSLMAAHGLGEWLISVTKRIWPSRERVAVVGSGPETIRIIDIMRGALDLQVAGVILPTGTHAYAGANWMPVLGQTNQLAEVINRENLDRIVIADEQITAESIDEFRRITKRMGVAVTHSIGAGGQDATIGVTRISNLNLVHWKPVTYTRKYELVKRGLDIFLAAASLLALAPLLVSIAILIKCTSKGPLLYKSKRVGRGGRYFTFFKFRSMRVDMQNREVVAGLNGKNGHLFKLRYDPRVTPVGRFLRRYSLDELPQLVNVLRGDMSMVGPRPLPASDLDPDGQSKEFSIWAHERSLVLPGITGLWQIRGRSDLTFEEMVQLDVHYIQNWSLALDLRILMETPLAVVAGRGAY